MKTTPNGFEYSPEMEELLQILDLHELTYVNFDEAEPGNSTAEEREYSLSQIRLSAKTLHDVGDFMTHVASRMEVAFSKFDKENA